MQGTPTTAPDPPVSPYTCIMDRALSTIYLASQSPRRCQLLEQIGVPFEVLLPDDVIAAERLEEVRAGEAPATYVRRVTRLKLEQALQQLAHRGDQMRLALCADTTVALGQHILGKPADESDARRMLQQLSGRTHRVLTAVSVGHEKRREQALNVSRVRFGTLTEVELHDYLASDEWRGKAGGYAIQGRAARFIEHISGSYSGVMGLPLFETAALLRSAAQQLARPAPAH